MVVHDDSIEQRVQETLAKLDAARNTVSNSVKELDIAPSSMASSGGLSASHGHLQLGENTVNFLRRSSPSRAFFADRVSFDSSKFEIQNRVPPKINVVDTSVNRNIEELYPPSSAKKMLSGGIKMRNSPSVSTRSPSSKFPHSPSRDIRGGVSSTSITSVPGSTVTAIPNHNSNLLQPSSTSSSGTTNFSSTGLNHHFHDIPNFQIGTPTPKSNPNIALGTTSGVDVSDFGNHFRSSLLGGLGGGGAPPPSTTPSATKKVSFPTSSTTSSFPVRGSHALKPSTSGSILSTSSNVMFPQGPSTTSDFLSRSTNNMLFGGSSSVAGAGGTGSLPPTRVTTTTYPGVASTGFVGSGGTFREDRVRQEERIRHMEADLRLRKLENDNEGLCRLVDEYKQQISDFEKTQIDILNENTDLKSRDDSHNEEVGILKEDIESLQNANERGMKENIELIERVKKLESTVQARDDTITRLDLLHLEKEEKLQKLIKVDAEKSAEITELQVKLDGRDQKLDELHKELPEIVKQRDDALEKLAEGRGKIISLDSLLKREQQKVVLLKDRERELIKYLEILQQEYEDVNGRSEILQKQLDDSMGRNNELLNTTFQQSVANIPPGIPGSSGTIPTGMTVQAKEKKRQAKMVIRYAKEVERLNKWKGRALLTIHSLQIEVERMRARSVERMSQSNLQCMHQHGGNVQSNLQGGSVVQSNFELQQQQNLNPEPRHLQDMRDLRQLQDVTNHRVFEDHDSVDELKNPSEVFGIDVSRNVKMGNMNMDVNSESKHLFSNALLQDYMPLPRRDHPRDLLPGESQFVKDMITQDELKNELRAELGIPTNNIGPVRSKSVPRIR